MDGSKMLTGRGTACNRATRRSKGFFCQHVHQRQQVHRVLPASARGAKSNSALKNVAFIGAGAALGAHSRLFLKEVQGVCLYPSLYGALLRLSLIHI